MSEDNYIDYVESSWGRERPDLDVWPMLVSGGTMRIAAVTLRAIAPIFSEHGIRGGEYEVLCALRRASAPYVLSPSELCRELYVTPSAMTKRLDNLEKPGFVARKPHPEDRRGVLIELSPSGNAMVDKLLPLVTERMAKELPLTKVQRRDLVSLLRVTVGVLDDDIT